MSVLEFTEEFLKEEKELRDLLLKLDDKEDQYFYYNWWVRDGFTEELRMDIEDRLNHKCKNNHGGEVGEAENVLPVTICVTVFVQVRGLK